MVLNAPEATGWRRPEILLYLMAGAVPLSFYTWYTLINNFAVERAAFGGDDMGILQSLREVPGFLAFAVVYLLLLWREQSLAIAMLFLMGLGTALTGYFPSVVGLCLTTFVMSVGFHYYETLQTSLSLQWVDKAKAPETLGRIIAVGSLTQIAIFSLVWVAFNWAGLDYLYVYLLGGGLTMLVAVYCGVGFPRFPETVRQHKRMVLRRRYWLYYALTFMSGARRQIFMVFAAFLLVEKFGFSVSAMSLLFLANAAMSFWLAPKVGRLIARWGERKALILEYLGLIGVFTAYAFVESAWIAAGLYVVDHVFFALAIAIKTYFQKIADPADIAGTAGVSFTINHIAAVFIPAAFGFLWLASPAAVFLCGSAMAVVSLLLSLNVPTAPQPGNEVVRGHRGARPLGQAAE